MQRLLAGVLFLGVVACHPGGGPGTAQYPSFLIRNARVFDGTKVLEATDVLVTQSTIVAVGPHLATPTGTRVIDGTNKTLLPGLIDSHFHTQGRGMLRQAAMFGVTTVADMNTDELRLAHVKKHLPQFAEVDEAELHGAGHLITAPKGWAIDFGGVAVPSAAACKDIVTARIAGGAEWIKIAVEDASAMMKAPVPALDPATVKACADAAHAAGVKIYAHVSTVAEAKEAVDAGIDGLAHSPHDAPMPDDLLAELAAKHVFVVSTLVTLHSLAGASLGPAATKDPAFAQLLDAGSVSNLTAKVPAAMGFASDRIHVDTAAATIARYLGAQVVLLAGTDAPVWGVAAGVSLHQELELLVAAGLTPIAALTAATSAPADAFGWHDRGRIAPGLVADLVMVDGDPTTRITATREISAVWKHGHHIDRDRWRKRVPLLDAGAAAYERKDYRGGAAAYAQALALDPSDGENAYLLAECEAQSGHLDAALDHLLVAVKFDPAFAAIAKEDPDLVPLRSIKRYGDVLAL